MGYGFWDVGICLLLNCYAVGSLTLERLPGERASNRVKVLGLLCTNLLVCDHTHTLNSTPPHDTHRPCLLDFKVRGLGRRSSMEAHTDRVTSE